MKKSWIVGFIAVLLIASCQSSGPLHQVTKGNVLTSYDFTGAGSFEEGAYGAATLQVIDGVYQIDVMQGDNVLWWGQWGDTYSDTSIDVDTTQEGDANDNTYGVMCRVQGNVGQKQPVDPTLAAVLQDSTEVPTEVSTVEAAATTAATAEATAAATAGATAEATAEMTAAATNATTAEAGAAATSEATAAATTPVGLATPALTATPQPTAAAISSGDGYLFLIQGSGTFAIMRARGRTLTPLVNWTSSDSIRQGASANHLRAVCAGNYLAFYINDHFVGDATDDAYTSGQVGLAASSANRVGTRIDFDNLTISEAAVK